MTTKGILSFPQDAPLSFPFSPGVTGGSDEFFCIPVVPGASINGSLGSYRFSVPAENQADAEKIITDSRLWDLREYGKIGATLTALSPLASDLLRSRNEYLSGLRNLKDLWIESGGKVTKQVAEKLYMERNKLRENVRASSNLSVREYAIIDRLKGSKEAQEKLLKRIEEGGHAKVIKSAFRDRTVVTYGVKTAGVGLKMLKSATRMATVVSIAKPAAELYAARSNAEEEVALSKFFEASGSAIGGIIGTTGGTALCAVLALGTSGTGLLACGALIGSSGYVAGELGTGIGKSAYEVIGPATLDLIRAVRSASENVNEVPQ